MRPSDLRALLEQATPEQLIVLRRRSERGARYSGYVLAVGAKWVLLARVADGGFFDGHIAFRITMHAQLDRSFESRAARLRPEWPPRDPDWLFGVDIGLDRTRDVLQAFGADGSLIAVQKDRRPDALWVGIVEEIRRHWLYLWEVRPTGEWKDRPLGYRIRRIAAIERGGQYLRGLADVAGSKPPTASRAV